MGRVHNKRSFSEAEIRTLLVYAFNSNQIDHETGKIKKYRLRDILRSKLQCKELNVLDVDIIGHVLNAHGYLLNCPKEEKMFMFDVKKLEEMAESARKMSEAKQEMINNSENPATFEYIKTIKRAKKHDFRNLIGMGVPICVVCSKCLFINGGRNHIDEIHGKTFDFPEIKGHTPVKQLFTLEYLVDGSCFIVKVKNLYRKGFILNQVQLVYDTNRIAILEYDWPCVISEDETLELIVNQHYFSDAGGTYSFIIHAERVKEYIEQHHLIIRNPLPDVISLKRSIVPKTEHKVQKTSFLPFYTSDKSILQLFTDDFLFRDGVKNLDVSKIKTYQTLIKFKHGDYQLTQENYTEVLMLLNEIEDLFIGAKLDEFSIEDARVKYYYRNKAIDINDVPDIPDIESGDTMILYNALDENIKPIECMVVKIYDGHIIFRPFRNQASTTLWTPYKIKFRKDRTVIRMGQHALTKVQPEIVDKILFPKTCGTPSEKYVCYDWFSEGIKTNNEQQQAVRNIVHGSSFPAPYIVFGPPGTGKTSTLVEAIAQIWKQQQKKHILVTASSNYACDEIATRLIKYIPTTDMYRYYSRCALNKIDDIQDELIVISNLTSGFHDHPSIHELYHYRIILTTLTTAGRLALNGMKKNFFDYIFIDEAGSSSEASAIIPISLLISMQKPCKTNIVIAGDPMQLGPIIHCKFAEIFGMGKSMLERLMEMDLYKPDPITKLYNEAVITKLLNNYRSHKDILHSANELFYAGELIPKAGPEITDLAVKWHLLPNKNLPVIFHAVEGHTQRETNSFSLFNQKEVSQVIFYVREIIKNGINGEGIPVGEIGVISPYRRQCQELRSNFKRYGWKDIEVGSVEQFQGQEKKVIILSTVRSFTKSIGFLDNPKRLNVSITRAKALLVVVGNPYTLQLDRNWFHLIKFCKENGACAGPDFDLRPPSGEHVDDNDQPIETYEEKIGATFKSLIERIEQLTISTEKVPDDAEKNNF
ncbi:putative helicase MOV-10 [Culicoides brevitarsis]|uniref:putative helicase MOV-10 n=1 Tax=Culicoides brevitarsis TaxID=469753 RepID=UPI00307B6FA5